MGIDVDIIFKIAGVGLVVAFLHTILDQVGKKEYAQWVTLFGFIYILFMVASVVEDLFQKLNLYSYFSKGGLAIEIIKIVAIALVATFLALIVKEQKPNLAFLLIVFVGCSIFLFLADKIYEIILMLEKIAVNANVNTVYLETILKIIGIAYIAEFASQITKDAGQGSLASKIELSGKILILAMAIPILTVIIETIIQMLPS